MSKRPESIFTVRIGAKIWFSLPLKLRQHWWRETDYGKHAPSLALLKEIETHVQSTMTKSDDNDLPV